MRNVLKAKGKNSLEIQEGRTKNIEERIIQLIRHEVENHKRSKQLVIIHASQHIQGKQKQHKEKERH